MNNELSNTDNGFNAWADKLETMTDEEICYEIHDRIMNNSDIDKESLELFDLSFHYCMKLISQNKPLESNLLKIYLQDVHHKDVNQINIFILFALLGTCGITFKE